MKKKQIYKIEPHGDVYALYCGRDKEHHGLRLCNLSDFDGDGKQLMILIELALNSLKLKKL